ncbi:unnamed protein product [Owenia fusiformis]|uniref:SEC14-like protein 1 n=1 Tax=Owenia fusiformis TaxID=6347 RepID=A0A8S4PPH8_OWEFU|nr:unnamed protein product [Owenia fusiformis]
MVQKYQSPLRVYKHPFELVMAAYEKRFPTCKMIPVFLGSDTLSEYKSDDGAIHVIERRCRLNVDAPYLLKKIAGVEHVNFIQKNSLDLRSRVLVINAYNESFSSKVTINENCKYSVHPDNPNWTCFEQDASLDIKSFFGFESTVEKLAMKQYTTNIKKGKQVIEYFLNELEEEGITFIPIWTEPAGQAVPSVGESTTQGVEDEQTTSHHKSEGSKESDTSLELGATASALTKEDSKDGGEILEEEYIERYLGKLSPLQETRLIQLNNWLQETHKGKVPRDAHILRFLKARDFNLEKAREMLCHSLAWRKLHRVDKLLHSYKQPEVLQQYFAGGWHHHDKAGRPTYILRLGLMDVKGLYKSVGEEGLLRQVISINEEGLARAGASTKARGHPVSACTCIVDLEGLSMRHLWRPGISALLRIIEICEANYPETMGQLLIVRAPRVFPVLWTLISPFIDDNTRKKFMIYGGNDYQGPGGLIEFVDQQYIPDFLGGECYCNIPEGGMVPKSMYMSHDEDSDKDRSPDMPKMCEDSLYHTAHVVKDFPQEVLIQVPQKGSVITWDFDILKGDVTFSVLRSRTGLTTDPHEHHVHGAVGGIGSKQYIAKHMLVGVDISIVEPPHVCRDGDSIQGSHVTSQAGAYILQWKYFDSAKASHSFDFSLSTHKSKVMYYTELLRSEDFRGSMSSLQSCQSSFSSLSIATNQSGANSSGGGSCPSR